MKNHLNNVLKTSDCVGYGLMLGYPTIIIPAIQGGDGRELSSGEQFHLNPEQISWISKYANII